MSAILREYRNMLPHAESHGQMPLFDINFQKKLSQR
jgi:hypothetical protein